MSQALDAEQTLCVQRIWPYLGAHNARFRLKEREYGKVVAFISSRFEEIPGSKDLRMAEILNHLSTTPFSNDTKRSGYLDSLREDIPDTQLEVIEEIAEFTLLAWAPLEIVISPNSNHRPRSVLWDSDASLSSMVQPLFESKLTGNHDAPTGGILEQRFNMHLMVDRYNWTVDWTDNLQEHLSLDLHNKHIKVFEHKIYLYNHLRQEPYNFIVQKAVLEEALRTLNLLFPPDDVKTAEYLEAYGRPFHELGWCGHGDKLLELDNYKYWRKEIATLHGQLSQEPRGIQQIWPSRDSRNFRDVVSFWIAGILAVGLALGFGITSTYYAALGYKMAVAQYDLALAQACSTAGANDSLPQYCS